MRAPLTLDQLIAGYPPRRGRSTIRIAADAIAQPGRLVALLGPNGAGKSTLLRTIAGLQSPLEGAVWIGGDNSAGLGRTERARRVAVVLADREFPPLLTAREVVGLGRLPHTGRLGGLGPEDHAEVEAALSALKAEAFADRPLTELSDGERQRVLVARALAQSPQVMLLDEPTAFLDVAGRAALLLLLRGLCTGPGSPTVIVSTHDLELALRVVDDVWLLDGDRVCIGTPAELSANGALGRVFDSDQIVFDPATGGFVLRR
ncbi:MAG: ABC transporter ATP-binding protein [Sporichthyaceae bacterium]